MIRLGKAHDSTITDEAAALACGANQFKIEYRAFRTWFDSEPWLRANALVAAAGGGNDGLAGIPQDSGFAAVREEITRFCDIIFSGRPGERSFWLGQGNEEQRKKMRRLRGPKPCLHGSDAHSLEKLFRPDDDRFCWIKADTTFEGLRSTMFEPEERVHIGPSPPSLHDEARVIASVALTGSNDWFESEPLPLNPGLVAVIGQKGSGKSALAELVAVAAGGWSDPEETGFVSRAHEHLGGLRVHLTWADGSITECEVDREPADENVRYLSQRFVERLAAEDHIGAGLVREVERVIFAHLDPTETLNASGFAELRSRRTEAIRAGRQEIEATIHRLIREADQLRANRVRLGERKQRVQALDTEADGLRKQTPPPQTPEEARLNTEMEAARTRLAALQSETATDKQQLILVETVRTRAAAFSREMARYFAEQDADLIRLGLEPEERALFRPALAGLTDLPLDRVKRAIQVRIEARQGAAGTPGPDTIAALAAQLTQLGQLATADKARRERLDQIGKRLAAIATEKTRLDSEIAAIEGPESARLQAIRTERLDNYVGMIEALSEEQAVLETLYAPVRAKLQAGKAQEQGLDFYIRWNVDLEGWLKRGALLFDQRRPTPHGSIEDLARTARGTLGPAWRSRDPVKIRAALETFIQPFTHQTGAASTWLRSQVTLVDLQEWLFSIEHVSLTYGLRYQGTELEKLSPGTKGIVLLILYLGMDTDDTRPLIIDQPEENLDSESIYTLLVRYFREAKKRRQIILITHNPNLVVNTDAEQVVIAHAERRPDGLPEIQYTSGALEDADTAAGVRRQVCRILEGGEEAFLDRERRYALNS